MMQGKPTGLNFSISNINKLYVDPMEQLILDLKTDYWSIKPEDITPEDIDENAPLL